MRLRSMVGVISLALALTPGAGAAAPSIGDDLCADIHVPFRNFKVEAKWETPTVSTGETARMRLLVTRTAEEDPVTDDGQPYPTGRPVDEPVDKVTIGMSMRVGNVYLNGEGVTKVDGQAIVKVKIERHTRPGTGISRLYAEKRHSPPDFPAPSCRVLVYEWGRLDPAPKLKVVR